LKSILQHLTELDNALQLYNTVHKCVQNSTKLYKTLQHFTYHFTKTLQHFTKRYSTSSRTLQQFSQNFTNKKTCNTSQKLYNTIHTFKKKLHTMLYKKLPQTLTQFYETLQIFTQLYKTLQNWTSWQSFTIFHNFTNTLHNFTKTHFITIFTLKNAKLYKNLTKLFKNYQKTWHNLYKSHKTHKSLKIIQKIQNFVQQQIHHCQIYTPSQKKNYTTWQHFTNHYNAYRNMTTTFTNSYKLKLYNAIHNFQHSRKTYVCFI